MILVSIAVKLLFRLIIGVLGKKLSFAIAVMYLGIRAARANGVAQVLKRARAWLRAALRSMRPDADEVT